jgi:hypothetical protein
MRTTIFVLFFLWNSVVYSQIGSNLEHFQSEQLIELTQDVSTVIFDDGEQYTENWQHEFSFSSNGTCLPRIRRFYRNLHHYQSYLMKYDEYNRLIFLSMSSPSDIIFGDDSYDQEFEYNSHGDVVVEGGHDAYSGWTQRYEYKYDFQGNIIRADIRSFSGVFFSLAFEYQYDDLGKLIKSKKLVEREDSNELFVSEEESSYYEGDLLVQKNKWTRTSEFEELKLSAAYHYLYDGQGNNTEILTSQLDTILDAIVPAFRETIVYVDGNVTERNVEQWNTTSEQYLPFELRNYSYYPETTFFESESFQKWNDDLQSYSYVYQRAFGKPCQHSSSQPFENDYPKLITNSSFYPMILFDEATKPSSLKVSFYSYDGKLLKEYSNPSNKDLYFEFKEAWRMISGLYLIHVETESYSKTFKWQRDGY